MYLDHFGLLEAPFSIAPDPRYLYMSERHREALAHLLYGMESDGAFILLTGDVGTGKTTVSRCLLEQVPDDTNLALVLNPKVTSIELLQVICDELRISYDKADVTVKSLVDFINRNLLGAHAQGKKTVVLIEEAQNLDLDVLEQLRLLTNLETNERKLLQVILLGQPEFLDVLDRPELSQLAQRITARFHLGPLKFNEVEEYVAHRLAIAGCRRPLFARGVIKHLYNYSGGVPRLINVICDRALLGCYVQNRHQIDKPTLVNAAQEVLGNNKAASIKAKFSKPALKYSALAAGLLMLVLGALYFSSFQVQVDNDDFLHENSTHENSSRQESATAILESNSMAVKKIQRQEAGDEDVNTEPAAKDSIIEDSAVIESNILGEINRGELNQGELNQGELSSQPLEEEALQNTQASGESLQQEPAKEQIQNYIQWPDSIKRLRSNLQSYQALFERWQLDYSILVNGTPCFFAQTQGLSCVHEQSGMEGLRQFNRPAVLTLYDDSNQRQYITLLTLKKDSAVIVISGATQHIELQQLLFYWKGEFSLLWRKPPGYDDLIRPGSAGKAVLWLSKRMNEINPKPELSQRSYYDKALVKQVKAFQAKVGLNDDGVVGIKTLIQINQVTGDNTPLLVTS